MVADLLPRLVLWIKPGVGVLGAAAVTVSDQSMVAWEYQGCGKNFLSVRAATANLIEGRLHKDTLDKSIPD